MPPQPRRRITKRADSTDPSSSTCGGGGLDAFCDCTTPARTLAALLGPALYTPLPAALAAAPLAASTHHPDAYRCLSPAPAPVPTPHPTATGTSSASASASASAASGAPPAISGLFALPSTAMHRRRAAALRATLPAPLATAAVLADVQFVDKSDGRSYLGAHRRYRRSRDHLTIAAATWAVYALCVRDRGRADSKASAHSGCNSSGSNTPTSSSSSSSNDDASAPSLRALLRLDPWTAVSAAAAGVFAVPAALLPAVARHCAVAAASAYVHCGGDHAGADTGTDAAAAASDASDAASACDDAVGRAIAAIPAPLLAPLLPAATPVTAAAPNAAATANATAVTTPAMASKCGCGLEQQQQQLSGDCKQQQQHDNNLVRSALAVRMLAIIHAIKEAGEYALEGPTPASQLPSAATATTATHESPAQSSQQPQSPRESQAARGELPPSLTRVFSQSRLAALGFDCESECAPAMHLQHSLERQTATGAGTGPGTCTGAGAGAANGVSAARLALPAVLQLGDVIDGYNGPIQLPTSLHSTPPASLPSSEDLSRGNAAYAALVSTRLPLLVARKFVLACALPEHGAGQDGHLSRVSRGSGGAGCDQGGVSAKATETESKAAAASTLSSTTSAHSHSAATAAAHGHSARALSDFPLTCNLIGNHELYCGSKELIHALMPLRPALAGSSCIAATNSVAGNAGESSQSCATARANASARASVTVRVIVGEACADTEAETEAEASVAVDSDRDRRDNDDDGACSDDYSDGWSRCDSEEGWLDNSDDLTSNNNTQEPKTKATGHTQPEQRGSRPSGSDCACGASVSVCDGDGNDWSSDRWYYSRRLCPGWLVVALDSYQVSTLGDAATRRGTQRPPGCTAAALRYRYSSTTSNDSSDAAAAGTAADTAAGTASQCEGACECERRRAIRAQRRSALAARLLHRRNPNVALGTDWFRGISGRRQRWVPFNGGFGKQQTRWYVALDHYHSAYFTDYIDMGI